MPISVLIVIELAIQSFILMLVCITAIHYFAIRKIYLVLQKRKKKWRLYHGEMVSIIVSSQVRSVLVKSANVKRIAMPTMSPDEVNTPWNLFITGVLYSGMSIT